MQWYLDFNFYSPDRRHFIDLENLRLAAERWGIRFEVLGHHQFRNMQRFGARTTQTFIRIHGNDKDVLELYAASIYVSRS
jgi:hypothetical protein